MSQDSDSQQRENGTDAQGEPLTKPSLFEALFQAGLEGLLILLYMSAVFLLFGDLMGQQFQLGVWAIQGVGFAVVFVAMRTWTALRGGKRPNKAVKLKRKRWMMYLVTGAIVAVACGTKIVIGGTRIQSAAGLGAIAIVMAIVGAIGLARMPRAARGNAAR